jgi:DNA-binding MarR family transcriptional regulator
MPGAHSSELARDLLGSARTFASFLFTVCEQQPLQKIAGGSLTLSQARILQLVGISPGLTIHELAGCLNVTVAAAGQAVERLVQRGYLTRQVKEEDRRSSKLNLTRSGRRLLDTYRSAQEASLSEVMRRFSPGELRRATEIMDRLALALTEKVSAEGELCLECGAFFRERCMIRGLSRRNCIHIHKPARRSA